MANKKDESEESLNEQSETVEETESADDLQEEATDDAGSGEDPVEAQQTPTVSPDEAAAIAAAAVEEAPVTAPVAVPDPSTASGRKKDKGKGGDTRSAESKAAESKAADTKAAPAKAAPAPTPAAASAEEMITNEQAVASLFGPGGKESAATPISELKGADDEPMKHAGIIVVLAAIVLGGVIAGGTYGVLTDEQKHCLHLQLDGLSCVEYYTNLRNGRLDEERRQAVANAPRVGTVVTTTTPNNLRVTSNGQPDTLFIQGNTLAAPARTKITFQDIPADAPFTFTVHGDGVWQDRVVELGDYRSADTLWIQNPMTGDYSADLQFRPCFPGSAAFGASNCLYPAERDLLPGVAAWEELRWRTTWTPPAEPEEGQPTRLENAVIVVNSTPPGATVMFNGRPALGADGQACTTPCTFTQYAPAPNAQPGENGEPPAPTPVYLSREGLPLEVYIEGKLPTRTSVFAHNFVCNPVEGAVPTEVPAATPSGFPTRDYMGFCQYRYEVNLQVMDPPPPVVEGSGEAAPSN
jgi:hypothetical protein